MKRLLVLLFLTLPLLAPAAQRVVVWEDFTATWCTYCPGAARGLDELDSRAFDSVVCIAYHSSNSGDPYYNSFSATRASYYGLQGYPTVRMDGKVDSVVGGVHTGTMYPTYRVMFDRRQSVSSPLEIEAATTYDSASRAGQVTIVLRNPSGSAVSGQLQCAVIENHIYYPWQGMDSLQYLLRTMLPDAGGEAVTIPAGDSLVKIRNFTLATGIVARNCDIIVFVQNNSTRTMIQAARTSVQMEPKLGYAGYQRAFPEPGADANLIIGLSNLGSAAGTGVSAVLSTSDPYVTVTTPGASFADITRGDIAYSATPFVIRVDAGCPSPHLAMMSLAVTAAGGYTSTSTFPLNITFNPGYYDSMEAGVNGWTHSGIRDGWHQTTHRNTSPTHSWYCGIENSWQYNNECDARLMTPWFTVADGGVMSFRHWYASEADFDYIVVEIDNGSGRWAQLGIWDGTGPGWEPIEYDLAERAGQTTQVRFRFISDGSVTAEGWYIDDFWCSPVSGVTEQPVAPRLRLERIANPVTGPVAVSYQIPAGQSARVVVFDGTGREVGVLGRQLTGQGQVTWNLVDAAGRPVAAGAYFLRLLAGKACTTTRIVVSR